MAKTSRSRRRKQNTDPFVVIGRIPKGQSYQWIADAVHGSRDHTKHHAQRMKDAGWNPVLRARHHPLMRTVNKKHIIWSGQILCQRPLKMTEAALAEERAKIVEQKRLSDEMMLPGKGDRMRVLASSSVVAESYDSGAIHEELALLKGNVPVSIAIRLTEREIDAAAACRLTASEYARRKVLLIQDLNIQNVLAPVSEGIFEFAVLTLKRPSEES